MILKMLYTIERCCTSNLMGNDEIGSLLCDSVCVTVFVCLPESWYKYFLKCRPLAAASDADKKY